MSEVLAQAGVPWAEGIPPGWKLRRVREAVDLMSGFPFESTNFTKVSGVRLIRIRDLLSDDDVTYYDGPDAHRARVVDGDLLVGMDGDFNVVLWDRGDAILNQRMCALRPRPGFDIRFIRYLLPAPLKIVNDLTYYTTVKHLSNYQILDIRFVDPGGEGQRAIADFLDRKTAAIDALIAKKERLIELLEEKRQALITQAVTKGLDPNVPMKDSGIDWLGPIPAHWEVKRLKHLASVQSGVTKGRSLEGETIELPYLRVANVQDGYVDLSDVATIEVAPHEVRRFALRTGDILMNEGGDNDKLGRGAVWDGQIEPCLHQNHVFALRPGPGVDAHWIALCMRTAVLKLFFQSRAKQSTNLASISSTNLKEAPVVLPPPAEIHAILRHVDDKLARLDRLVAYITEHVDRLREYRQALITAAVTGKIDVTQEQA